MLPLLSSALWHAWHLPASSGRTCFSKYSNASWLVLAPRLGTLSNEYATRTQARQPSEGYESDDIGTCRRLHYSEPA